MENIKNKKNTVSQDDLAKRPIIVKTSVKSSQIEKAMLEVRDTVATTSTLVVSALTLVASLAWSDFAKAIFERLKEKISGWGEIFGLFIYASVVTLIVVLIVKRLQGVSKRVGGKSVK